MAYLGRQGGSTGPSPGPSCTWPLTAVGCRCRCWWPPGCHDPGLGAGVPGACADHAQFPDQLLPELRDGACQAAHLVPRRRPAPTRWSCGSACSSGLRRCSSSPWRSAAGAAHSMKAGAQ